MRKIRIIAIVSTLLVVAAMSSCQKEDNMAFEKSATERLNDMIEDVKSILVAEENGWVMKCYVGSNASSGGFVYTVKFNSSDAEVGFEYASNFNGMEQDATLTSLYKVTDDNGPVLSFDTYNSFIHYFSTPSSAYYQALGGDFEFEIVDISPEKIEMIGRRSRNIVTLEPLEMTGSEYINGVVEMAGSFNPYYVNGKIGTEDVKGTVSYDTRHIRISTESGSQNIPFCFVPDGISLYYPIDMGGVQIQELKYDIQTMKLSAESVDLQGAVPEGWLPYDTYAGDYTLKYAGSFTADITLTPAVTNSTYVLSGLNKKYTLELKYNMQTGKLMLYSQLIGAVGDYSVYFSAWALDCGGSITWAPSSGMMLEKNTEAEGTVYDFVPNGYVWRNASGTKCTPDSFILIASNSVEAYYYDDPAWGTNGYPQWPYIESITKK